MGKQIVLPNIDFAKVGNTLVKTGKTVVTIIHNHFPALLTTIIAGVTIDNIHVRISRKKDQKAFEEKMVKQQQVIRKHEAEINVMKDEAEQVHEAMQKVESLTKIVNSMTKGGTSE